MTKPISLLGLLALFAGLAVVGGPANGLEPGLMRAIAGLRANHPDLTHMVTGVTNLGAAYATLGVTAIGSVCLLFRRKPGRALLLASLVLIERALVESMKLWIGRPRPTFGVEWLPSSLAFPSGHAANSMTAFLATALILAPAARRGPWASGAIALSIAVGLSRIYLGVHWPTDVLGGWIFALVAVGCALMLGRRLGALEPQHQIVGRHRPALNEKETA